jgi:hypothetical protein
LCLSGNLWSYHLKGFTDTGSFLPILVHFLGAFWAFPRSILLFSESFHSAEH